MIRCAEMKKTFAEYLASGMDERTAHYFAAGRRRVVSAKPSQGYTVVLTFDNGETRVLDCKRQFAEGSLFNKLAEPEAFSRVFVDEGGNLAWDIDPAVDSNVVWSNRIDFCRDACYLNSTPIQ